MYRATCSIDFRSSGSKRTLSSTENPLLWFQLIKSRARSSFRNPSLVGAVALLKALLPEALDLVVKSFDEVVQGRLLRLAGWVESDRTFWDQGMLLPVSQRGGIDPA